MFTDSLKNSVLSYLGSEVTEADKRIIEQGLNKALQRRAEFEQQQKKIKQEIENGTRRSSGKLSVLD